MGENVLSRSRRKDSSSVSYIVCKHACIADGIYRILTIIFLINSFLNSIARIADADYVPSLEDIAHL